MHSYMMAAIDYIEEVLLKGHAHTRLEENFSTALNNQAPEITKVITERKKKPWFRDDLKQQKRRVRTREKVFMEYRLYMLDCF